MDMETCPVALEWREKIENLRSAHGHKSSSHAFSSLFIWKEWMGLSLYIKEGMFAVKSLFRGENAWFFPCGGEEETLAFIARRVREPDCSLHYMRRSDVELLQRHMPGRFEIRQAREDSEYVYRLSEQIELPGREYKNMRKKINRARTHSRWTVLELDRERLGEAGQIIQAWGRTHEGDTCVAMSGLEHYEELGFQGILLESSEQGPCAVAFGSLITPDTFDLHVTKTLMPGIDSYLKWELYRRLPAGIRWINQEEDLGLPGLRANKMEAMPVELVPLWSGIAR